VIKRCRITLIVLLAMLVGSCTAPTMDRSTSIATQIIPSATAQSTPITLPEAQIARYPAPDDYSQMHLYTKLPTYDPNSDNAFQMDLRSAYLEDLDFSGAKTDLLHALFDSKTQWPASNKMPADFDWQSILETGKNPGLGIRSLHEEGITGKGVNIAIIDQPLIIDHIEYPSRIRLYEETNVVPGTPSQMHGPGVTSIAVGKTVGVAPDANVYYIAAFDFDPYDANHEINYKYTAQAIQRILEINRQLPADQKIRAISMSIGLNPANKGYDEFIAAIGEAKEAGIFPITVSLGTTHGQNILGLGRNPLSDPDQFQSYEPSAWWAQDFFKQGSLQDTLLIPMDSRTTASPTGQEDYVFYAQGGMSWTVPYLAGLYALAVQVRPDITPEEFLTAAMKTGKTIQIQRSGKEYALGTILDPRALIEEIKNK
jgi:subtilisin family serine protease